MEQKKVVIIIGKSGSGKTSIKNKLLEKDRTLFHNVINFTTRPQREGEKEGDPYFFCSEKDVVNLIFAQEVVECTSFNEWLYGTFYNAFSPKLINIGVWNPESAEILNDEEEFDCLNVLIQTDDKVRLIRSLSRDSKVDVNEVIRRYKADEKDFSNLSFDNLLTFDNNDENLDELVDNIYFNIKQFYNCNFGQNMETKI